MSQIAGRGRDCGSRFCNGFDGFYDSVKAFGIGNGNLTEHLSIQCNTGLLAAIDELAVPYAALPAGGVQTDNPKPAKFTLSPSSVFLSIDVRTYSSLFG